MYPRQGLVPLFVIGGLLRPTVSRRNVADRVRFRCLDITTLLKIARPRAERSQFRFFVFRAISTVLYSSFPSHILLFPLSQNKSFRSIVYPLTFSRNDQWENGNWMQIGNDCSPITGYLISHRLPRPTLRNTSDRISSVHWPYSVVTTSHCRSVFDVVSFSSFRPLRLGLLVFKIVKNINCNEYVRSLPRYRIVTASSFFSWPYEALYLFLIKIVKDITCNERTWSLLRTIVEWSDKLSIFWSCSTVTTMSLSLVAWKLWKTLSIMNILLSRNYNIKSIQRSIIECLGNIHWSYSTFKDFELKIVSIRSWEILIVSSVFDSCHERWHFTLSLWPFKLRAVKIARNINRAERKGWRSFLKHPRY